MFEKLLAILLAVGAIGCALLVNRQQRIEASHEMASIHNRLREHRRALWALRADIAALASPAQLQIARRQTAERWVPIAVEDPAATAVEPAPEPGRRVQDRDASAAPSDPSGPHDPGAAEDREELGG